MADLIAIADDEETTALLAGASWPAPETEAR